MPRFFLPSSSTRFFLSSFWTLSRMAYSDSFSGLSERKCDRLSKKRCRSEPFYIRRTASQTLSEPQDVSLSNASTTRLTDIPDDTWAIVFTFLYHVQYHLDILPRVCKAFKKIVNSSDAWSGHGTFWIASPKSCEQVVKRYPWVQNVGCDLSLLALPLLTQFHRLQVLTIHNTVGDMNRTHQRKICFPSLQRLSVDSLDTELGNLLSVISAPSLHSLILIHCAMTAETGNTDRITQNRDGLGQLTTLRLMGCTFTEDTLRALCPRRLVHLSIFYTVITVGEMASAISHCTDLETIILQGNPQESMDGLNIRALRKVRVFSLDSLHLQFVPAPELTQLRNLTHLTLRCCSITDQDLDFTRWPFLEYLSLNYCTRFQGNRLEGLVHCPRMAELRLVHMHSLRYDCLKKITACNQLRKLTMECSLYLDNDFIRTISSHFTSLRSLVVSPRHQGHDLSSFTLQSRPTLAVLEELELRYWSAITKENIMEHILPIPSLRKLKLTGCSVRPHALSELTQVRSRLFPSAVKGLVITIT